MTKMNTENADYSFIHFFVAELYLPQKEENEFESRFLNEFNVHCSFKILLILSPDNQNM